MTLDLSLRFQGTHDLIEMECRESDCNGRMLLDKQTARRLGLTCPMPTCDTEVRTA